MNRIVPPLITVPPVYAFAADSVSTPGPSFVSVPIELPIAPEMVVFDQPETLSPEPAVVADSAPESVRVFTPEPPLFTIVRGWLAPAATFAATIWLVVVAPETVMPAAPLLTVIVCAFVPIV